MPPILLAIRTIIFYIVFALWSVVWIGACIGPCCLFPLRTRHRILVIPWCYVSIYLLRFTCNIKWVVHNFHNLPSDPVILVSNHQSAWETLFFQTIISPQVQVVKRELLTIPFFGWGLSVTGAIAIDRKRPQSAIKQLIRQSKSFLARKFSILIFPEGTRANPGQLKTFSNSIATLAVTSKATIIPIAHNSGICWRYPGFIKYPGTIDVFIGPPIDTTKLPAKSITPVVKRWIEETLTNNNTKKANENLFLNI